MTDEDAILQADNNRMFILDIPPVLQARVAPGRRVRVQYHANSDPPDPGGTLHVTAIQAMPQADARSSRPTMVAGARRKMGAFSGSSAFDDASSTGSTSALATDTASQLLKFYTEPSLRGSDVSTLFMIVDICGQKPSITQAVGYPPALCACMSGSRWGALAT